MPDNKTDSVFKEKIEQLEKGKFFPNWDKNSSWERLQTKRKNKRNLKLFYAAAFLIIGLLVSNLYQNSYYSKQKNDSDNYENSFVEYQKRQKLKEIESRMSGNYFSVKICYACEYFYYELIKQDRPAKFTYFENPFKLRL